MLGSPVKQKSLSQNGVTTSSQQQKSQSFALFNDDTFLDLEDGATTFKAGIEFRPKPTLKGGQESEVKRAFVTTVINSTEQPIQASKAFTTSSAALSNGSNSRASQYSDDAIDGIGQIVGKVTVTEMKNGVSAKVNEKHLHLPLPPSFGKPMINIGHQAWDTSDQHKKIKICLRDHNTGKKYGLYVTKADTVDQLKQKISGTVGISVRDQELTYGKTMTSVNTLSYYGITENCTVNLMTNPVGG